MEIKEYLKIIQILYQSIKLAHKIYSNHLYVHFVSHTMRADTITMTDPNASEST